MKMNAMALVLSFACFLSSITGFQASMVFNVDNYGAVADGMHDNTIAFQKAWKAACTAGAGAVFTVPAGGKYLVKPTTFAGPCRGNAIAANIVGMVVAPADVGSNSDQWLLFDSIEGLSITGGGTLDGSGSNWWNCRSQNKCSKAPTSVKVLNSRNVTISNIKLVRSPGMHLDIHGCMQVDIRTLSISSPADSPNTDGIHVGSSTFVSIASVTIATGDDCISIVSGSSHIRVRDVSCGPGHGISIGSLGDDGDVAMVSDVEVNGAQLRGTTNGVRIKTWQGGSGKATDIRFLNVQMKNVESPIVVDQYYCNTAASGTCGHGGEAVQISGVLYQNITGTSATPVGISLNCSSSLACKGMRFSGIDLLQNTDGAPVAVLCNNAYGSSLSRNVPTLNCLKS